MAISLQWAQVAWDLDVHIGDDFGGLEAGSSIGNFGGGNMSMLEGRMAAMTFSGPQQQQQ